MGSGWEFRRIFALFMHFSREPAGNGFPASRRRFPVWMAVRVESPFPSPAWPRVWSWLGDFRSRVCDDYSPQNVQDFVIHMMRKARDQETWAVHASRGGGPEELCGMITYEPTAPGVGTTHALFRKDYWGHDITVPALSTVYAGLFERGVRKIIGAPFRDNRAIVELGRKLGARVEGRLRAQTMRGGKPVDVVLLGLLKEDFDSCRFSPH